MSWRFGEEHRVSKSSVANFDNLPMLIYYLRKGMVENGARKLFFLSRSGGSSAEAQALCNELDEYATEFSCAKIYTIIRGDVAVREDVDNVVFAAKQAGPIKGVIQAAAVFKEDLFDDMTVDSFHAVVDPKVKGTTNLHQALLEEPLDFFVMTSSTLGIKGPATQSAYAAANAFLDAMARHRWSLGLQATSLSLGMVQEIGHIEEHPEIQEALLNTGLYGITEEEFLIMMEMACRPRDFASPPPATSKWDVLADAHIVTGLEIDKLSLSTHFFFEKDLRFRCLPVQSLPAIASVQSNTDTTSILASAKTAGGENAMKDAMKTIVLTRFSKLVMVPSEQLEAGLLSPLTDFGMDSMVSSEIRAVAWKEFGAEIPFMKVLERGFLLGELIDLIWEKMILLRE